MFRRIVVAYDGSSSAQDALALALRLRDPAEGALVLACAVMARGRHLPGRSHAADEAARAASAMLADARSRLPAGIPVTLEAPVTASVARGLTELAETERADLIAIGSSKGAADGRIGLARTAGRLLQGAPCAVAIAPPGMRETGPLHHVGVAVDDSPEAAAALSVAFAVARAAGSAVTLYTAIDPVIHAGSGDAQQLRLAMNARLDAAAESAPEGVNAATVLLHGAAGRVIADACDGVVELLAVGSRSYGPVQRVLLGSVSEELIARARHPVLVIPRQRRETAAGDELTPAVAPVTGTRVADHP